MSASRRDHVDEQVRFADREAELRALLKEKGYEVAQASEVIGGPRRPPADDSEPPHTSEETL
ncbi:MAG: hypothetical protein ACR2KQ_04190 [Actinomycetota bacterium]